MCRYRAGLLGFVSCVVLLLATTNFAVMFAPVPGRGPAHLSDRYSDFQQRFLICRIGTPTFSNVSAAFLILISLLVKRQTEGL